MPERMSAEEYRKLAAKPARQRKYRNCPCVGFDGRTYASQLEADHAAELDVQLRAGLIRGFLPQVSLPVPGTKRRLVIDFLVIRADGQCELHDTKGVETPVFKVKREAVEHALGLPITLIKKGRIK